MKRIRSQARHRTYAALVASAILVYTHNPCPCNASTDRRSLWRERDNTAMNQPRLAADSSDSCTTLLSFRYDCSNDLLTDYDHDNRILTVRDYTHYVNKIAHQSGSFSETPSSQPAVYGNQSSWSSKDDDENFKKINDRFQMVYIEHLCEAYLSRGTVPQFRRSRYRRKTRQPFNSTSYSSLQECYFDLLQHSIDNSTLIFGYPSDDVTIQDVNELCQDLFHLTITMGYVSSCDPECVTRQDFLPLCSDKLSLYAGPTQPVTSEDYTELIQLLQSMSPSSSSSSSWSYNMTFPQLDMTLQQNFIQHICTYQQQGATEECQEQYTALSTAQPIGYPSYADSSQDMINLCSDLFELATCLNYITPCDGQINITEKCIDMDTVLHGNDNFGPTSSTSPFDDVPDRSENVSDLPPLEDRSPPPSPTSTVDIYAVNPSPEPLSSANSFVAFVSEPIGIVVCAASAFALFAIVVGIFVGVIRKQRRKAILGSPVESIPRPCETTSKTSARIRVDNGGNYHGLSDDLISEAGAQSLTNAEAEALSRSRKAYKSNV